MESRAASLEWLENPEVFEVNRMGAHSDHRYYENRREMARGKMRLRQDLNGAWKFSYAENPGVREVSFYRDGYDLSRLGEIVVPGYTQLQGYDKCQYIDTMYPRDGHVELRPPHVAQDYNPVGSYVKEFDLEDALENKRVSMSFQSMETAFYVWLNGEFVGYGEDSFMPSEFELVPFIRKMGNRPAVEVYKRSSASWIEDQDFFRFPDIFRDVYLYAVPKVYVRDLFMKAGLEDCYRDGVFSAGLELTGKPELMAGCLVNGILYDQEDTVMCHRDRMPCEEKVTLGGKISRVYKWSGEDPYLYTLALMIVEDPGDGNEASEGHVIETLDQTMGFRTFEMIDKIMRLNGQRLVFHGINRHKFNARRGWAATKANMLWDIYFMKQHNTNAVWTCHYPNQSLWYESCDEFGIYLIDEANLESYGSWQKMGVCESSWNVPGSLPERREAVVDRAKSMLEQNKNHPSVLIWSCGNGSYAGEDILTMSRFLKERDGSRLVHYEGVFWNWKFNDISDMENRMYAKPTEVEEYLRRTPEKPFILCEHMHAMGNSLDGIKKYTDSADKYPMYQGGFIWDYIDQALAQGDLDGKEGLGYGGDFMDRLTDYNFCGNGIVYGDGMVPPKAQKVKYLYQNLELEPEPGVIWIQNKSLFVGTGGYESHYQVLKDGEQVWEIRFTADVAPQSRDRAVVKMPSFSRRGEYAYQVPAVLREKTLWAEEGFEAAFGETAVKTGGVVESARNAGIARVAAVPTMKMIHGGVNIGVRGNGFYVLFSRTEGGIVALRSHGQEWITRASVLTHWRASTDNDRGSQFAVNSAVRTGADCFRGYQNSDVDVLEEIGRVTATYTHRLPVVPKAIMEVKYVVAPDGYTGVKCHYYGQPGLLELPPPGMRLRFLRAVNIFSWYGQGPEESYVDKYNGARLGIYEGTPTGSMSRYLLPQERGNHTGVRRLELCNRNGGQLKFTVVDTPFEISVSSYTAEELESARYMEELPAPHYIVVNVLTRQRGVGGDDSWGAPVYPEYCISGEGDVESSFVIECV